MARVTYFTRRDGLSGTRVTIDGKTIAFYGYVSATQAILQAREELARDEANMSEEPRC